MKVEEEEEEEREDDDDPPLRAGEETSLKLVTAFSDVGTDLRELLTGHVKMLVTS